MADVNEHLRADQGNETAGQDLSRQAWDLMKQPHHDFDTQRSTAITKIDVDNIFGKMGLDGVPPTKSEGVEKPSVKHPTIKDETVPLQVKPRH